MKQCVCRALSGRAVRAEGGLLAKNLEARRQRVPQRRGERLLKAPGAEGGRDRNNGSHESGQDQCR